MLDPLSTSSIKNAREVITSPLPVAPWFVLLVRCTGHVLTMSPGQLIPRRCQAVSVGFIAPDGTSCCWDLLTRSLAGVTQPRGLGRMLVMQWCSCRVWVLQHGPHGPVVTSWGGGGVRTSSSSHLHYFTVPRSCWDMGTLTWVAVFCPKPTAAAVALRWSPATLRRRLPARELRNTRSASSSFIFRVRWAILGVN